MQDVRRNIRHALLLGMFHELFVCYVKPLEQDYAVQCRTDAGCQALKNYFIRRFLFHPEQCEPQDLVRHMEQVCQRHPAEFFRLYPGKLFFQAARTAVRLFPFAVTVPEYQHAVVKQVLFSVGTRENGIGDEYMASVQTEQSHDFFKGLQQVFEGELHKQLLSHFLEYPVVRLAFQRRAAGYRRLSPADCCLRLEEQVT